MANDDDLFTPPPRSSNEGYDASSIEVLEGLEPIRRRPGMYIGAPTSGRSITSPPR